jgi:heme/copper-type cytochrome/quinol oxidase subunit 2
MTKKTREERRQARQRQKQIRAAAFWLIVIVVIGAAGYLLKPVFFRPPKPPMAGTVIDVAADMSGFDMKEIRVKAGEPVTIRLESLDNQYHTDGGGKHQLAVDELGIDIIAPPLGTEYATFTPGKAGTYTFYCDICCGGKANPTMSGTLIVES